MATQEILQVYGKQLLFADATDFDIVDPMVPNTAANSVIIGIPTVIQIDLTSVAAAGMWQSTKTLTLARTGSAWPIEWVLGACMENVTAPTAGGTFDFYWNASPNSTGGTGNAGGCSGADGTYTAVGLAQLIVMGSLTVRNTTINIDTDIGKIWLPHLYGSLVVVNNTSTSTHTAMDETHITLTPIIPDVQAAA